MRFIGRMRTSERGPKILDSRNIQMSNTKFLFLNAISMSRSSSNADQFFHTSSKDDVASVQHQAWILVSMEHTHLFGSLHLDNVRPVIEK